MALILVVIFTLQIVGVGLVNVPKANAQTTNSILDSAVVNGTPLDVSNPVITVAPGASITGSMTTSDRDPCSFCILPVVGINSWDRTYYASLGNLPGDFAFHPFTFTFSFTAPTVPGDYYIVIFHRGCYTAADDVYGCYAPGDPREGVPGGGDDVWDLGTYWNTWESLLPSGDFIAGRAIKITVVPQWKSNLITKITGIKGKLQGVLDSDRSLLASTLNLYKVGWNYDFDTAQVVVDGYGYATAVFNLADAWDKLGEGIVKAGWSSTVATETLGKIGESGVDAGVSVIGYIMEGQKRNQIDPDQRDIDRQNFFKASGSLLSNLKSASGLSDYSSYIADQLSSDSRFRYSTASSKLDSTLSDLRTYIINYPGNDPPSGLDLNYLNNCLDQISNQIDQVGYHQRATIMFPNAIVSDFPDMYEQERGIANDIGSWKGGQVGSMIFSAGSSTSGIVMLVLVHFSLVTGGIGLVVLLGVAVAYGVGQLWCQFVSKSAFEASVTAQGIQLANFLHVTYSTVAAMQSLSDFVKSSLTTLPTVLPSGSIQSIARASKDSVTVTVQNTGSVTNGYLTVQFSTLDGKMFPPVYEELTVGQGQTVAETIAFNGLNWIQSIFGGTFNVNAEFNLGFRQVSTYGPVQVNLGGLLDFSGWYGTPGTTNVPLASVSYGDPLYLFGVNPAGTIWYKSMGHDGVWTNWQLIPGVTDKALNAVSYNGYLHLFGSDPNGLIWVNRMDSSGAWSGWNPIRGVSNKPFSAVSFYGRLYLFAVDPNGAIWVNTMDVTEVWSGWQRIDGVTDKPLSAVVFGDYIFLFGVDPGGYMWLNRMGSDGVWSGWQPIPGAPVNLPVYAGAYDKLYLLAVDPAGSLWRNEMDSTGAWSGWILLNGATDKPLNCAAYDSRIYLLGVDASGRMWYSYTT